jgi:GntR family transcriptional repressor for pyruvate dehydrogenase complex
MMARRDERTGGAPSTRLYRHVIDVLRAEIEGAVLRPGDRLPSEKRLVERFNVSRLTIREAVIGLEILGLVEPRHGSGVFVRSSRVTQAAPTGGLDIGPVELIEARRIVEVQTAALAALEATDEQIAAMRDILADMDKEERAEGNAEWIADRDFHLAIARASQNAVLAMMVEAMWDLRRRSPLSHEMLERIARAGQTPRIADHHRILEAIEKRDPTAARRAMRAHLDRVMADLLDFTELEAKARVSTEIAHRRETARRRAAL